MLTDKQRDIMEQYCNLDLSLAEISENLDISRQAVHDTIKRSEKALEKVEDQLGLYQRYITRQMEFESIEKLLVTFMETRNEEKLSEILKIVRSAID